MFQKFGSFFGMGLKGLGILAIFTYEIIQSGSWLKCLLEKRLKN